MAIISKEKLKKLNPFNNEMDRIVQDVEKELENLGLGIGDIENMNILEACISKVTLADNLKEEGIDFDKLEEEIYPDSTFIFQMIKYLDAGGNGEDMIVEFLALATYHSPELQAIFDF